MGGLGTASYLAPMQWLRAGIVSGLLSCFSSLAAQSNSISLERLRDSHAQVEGQGRSVAAIDLVKVYAPKHWIGDDSLFARRGMDDATWPDLDRSEDSIVPGATVHWLRLHLRPRADLKGVPLMLDAGGNITDAYLNGRPVLRAASPSATNAGPPVSVPLGFACDGEPEIVALRITVPAGIALEDHLPRVVLREAGSAYGTQLISLHHGVFTGVNLIIVLLSLILWYQDRRERSWLLLALLSFIEAFRSVADLASDQGLFGFPERTTGVLSAVSVVLMPWSLYLLILVLGGLHGGLARKKTRRYTRAVWFVTLIIAAVRIAMFIGGPGNSPFLSQPDGTQKFEFSDQVFESAPALLILLVVVGLVLGILFGLVFVWFAWDVVRLGLRLLRTRGYERWVGGGALLSGLVSGALAVVGGMLDLGHDRVEVLSDYLSYTAVPVAVAVYLAIRSAHNSRAVARQRDDLDREVHERTAELRAEKDRSDELLLNILPHEVAEELKAKGEARARQFDNVTILFTDFKGFTTASERMSPRELLDELNTCFKEFDRITTARGIEKIKTIGDAYMAAGGLPDPASSSPADVVYAALEMQAFMQRRQAERQAQGVPAFEMRVGIHSGPVVAGIVGVKKFQYDIWGDTVNTASRMESSGEVGQVNISEATYALVKDAKKVNGEWELASEFPPSASSHSPFTNSYSPSFTFIPRGKVQAKGKGEMEMYFVHLSPTT